MKKGSKFLDLYTNVYYLFVQVIEVKRAFFALENRAPRPHRKEQNQMRREIISQGLMYALVSLFVFAVKPLLN